MEVMMLNTVQPEASDHDSEVSTHGGEKTFLGNMSLSIRIGLLIVLGLLGLAVADGIAFFGAHQLEAASEAEEAFAEIDIAVLNADNGALLLRRREKDFLL